MKTIQCRVCDAIVDVPDGEASVVCPVCGERQPVDVPDLPSVSAPTVSPSEVRALSVAYPANSAVESLLKRGYMDLEDEAWEEATQHFDRALDAAPECALAYLGLAMAGWQLSDLATSGGWVELVDEDRYFKRAVKFADRTLQDYLDYAKDSAGRQDQSAVASAKPRKAPATDPVGVKLENVEAFFKLEKKQEAFSLCLKLCEEYPGDWRVWFKTAEVQTDNFTPINLFSGDKYDLWSALNGAEAAVQSALKLADPAQADQISARWKNYVDQNVAATEKAILDRFTSSAKSFPRKPDLSWGKNVNWEELLKFASNSFILAAGHAVWDQSVLAVENDEWIVREQEYDVKNAREMMDVYNTLHWSHDENYAQFQAIASGKVKKTHTRKDNISVVSLMADAPAYTPCAEIDAFLDILIAQCDIFKIKHDFPKFYSPEHKRAEEQAQKARQEAQAQADAERFSANCARRDELERELSGLGLFAGKRKKEIESELNRLRAEIRRHLDIYGS